MPLTPSLPPVVVRPAHRPAGGGASGDPSTASRRGTAAVRGAPAVLGAVTIVSDLGESLVKRSLGVKDSGHLFGESGGFLDLADSLLLVAPVSLAYIAFLA